MGLEGDCQKEEGLPRALGWEMNVSEGFPTAQLENGSEGRGLD